MTHADDAWWDVVGLGANSVDYVHHLPAFPQPADTSTKIEIERSDVSCGGQMATALAACARLGLRVRYIGAAGNDDNGHLIRRELEGRGVDLTYLVTHEARNQYAVVLIDRPSGERLIMWQRDERLALHDDEVPESALAAAHLLHVDDVDQPAAIRAARLARGRGITVTSDIDRLTPRTAELVEAVTIPMFAAHVPARLTGISDLPAALAVLRAPHHELMVVTLGADGALAADADTLYRVPGVAVHAVDTTGAGDVFRAGFLYARRQGWGVERQLRFANAAAAVSCTRAGALGGIPSRAEIDARL